jgi:LPS export ABC transporter permease LptF/LPS export ABC transporter permease LptG
VVGLIGGDPYNRILMGPRILDRYLVREIVGPLALGFLVYTFILLIRFLFESAEMIIRRGLSLGAVGELLLYTLPNIVVLTIPMSLLFGILIAVGRLASDSELVALRSSGISLMALYRPILLVSGFFTLVNMVLMLWVLPWGNTALVQLRLRIITETVAHQVEPRVFYPEFEGTLLYVFEMPEGNDRWHGVFLAQSLPTQKNQVTVAKWGRLRLDELGELVVLELEEAYTHEVDLDRPESYQISYTKRLERVLEDEFATTQRAKMSTVKEVRNQTLGELAETLRRPDESDELRNLARVEVHKKFAIPFACLVFGLCALPLGFNNRRGGKASGFALSIGVILVYYILIDNGENAARYGKMPPWLAMWLPNVVLAVTGLVLLARRNRDKSLLLTRIDRWVRRDLWARILHLQRRREARQLARRARRLERRGAPDLVLRLQRPRLVFPNVIDRYVIRSFGTLFLLVLLSGLSIYVIADLGQIVDEVIKNQVPRAVVIAYYRFLSLQIFYDIAPIIVLVTTLMTFSLLSRTNEVTALKALGVSLFRLALPALAASLAVVVLAAYLEVEVLPAANTRAAELNDVIRGREVSQAFRRADRQWLLGQGRYIYNYLRYDQRTRSLQRLQVFEFDDEHRLVGRLVAQDATFDEASGRWLFDDGWARRFDGVDPVAYTPFTEPRLVDYPETPDYFDSEIKAPEQMDYDDLEDYIAELERSGQAVPELRVQLYNKLAYPVISLVMALVALPFAFRLGRQGALYGIGLSVILGIVFIGIFAFFSTLGETGALPPAVAVWSPNVLFSLLAAYLFLGVRT